MNFKNVNKEENNIKQEDEEKTKGSSSRESEQLLWGRAGITIHDRAVLRRHQHLMMGVDVRLLLLFGIDDRLR